MKRLTFMFFLAVSSSVFSQKVTKATSQKTYAGMGGVFMNYLIDLKTGEKDSIVIDSVVTMADPVSVKFGFTKFAPCCQAQVSFNYALSPPAKCRTCPDVTPKPYNTTKGVVVYFRNGEKKKSFVVKKFRQLPDLRLP